MPSIAGSEWGEEVLPGVQIIARRHNPHVEIARLAHEASLRGEPVALEVNYEKIHCDIDAIVDLMKRLEATNRYLRDVYLRERHHRGGRDDAAAATAPPHTVDPDDDEDDEVVHDAIRENEHILLVKRRELEELRQLTRMHVCRHGPSPATAVGTCGDGCHGGFHVPQDEVEAAPEEPSASSSDAGEGDGRDEPMEEEVMDMATMLHTTSSSHPTASGARRPGGDDEGAAITEGSRSRAVYTL